MVKFMKGFKKDMQQFEEDMHESMKEVTKALNDLRFDSIPDTPKKKRKTKKKFKKVGRVRVSDKIIEVRRSPSKDEEDMASVNRELAEKVWKESRGNKAQEPHPKQGEDFRGESFRDYVMGLEEENKKLRAQLAEKEEHAVIPFGKLSKPGLHWIGTMLFILFLGVTAFMVGLVLL